MIGRTRFVSGAVILAAFMLVWSGCRTGTPTTTTVRQTVATLQQSSSLVGCAGTTPPALPQEPQDWWNAMQPANRQFPFAGWEAFQTGVGGCAATRVDAYRAVVTFDLGSVSNLKGLVQSAALTVRTRPLPAAQGTTLNAGPLGQAGSINLFCVRNLGGAGALVRFGPGTAANVPSTSTAGDFQMLGASPFPAGTNVVYTFPNPVVTGSVAGATDPTTATLTGTGGSIFETNVTGAVIAALNANATSLSWMLTSNNEGPLPAALTTTGDVDCRTSYSFNLVITHY